MSSHPWFPTKPAAHAHPLVFVSGAVAPAAPAAPAAPSPLSEGLPTWVWAVGLGLVGYGIFEWLEDGKRAVASQKKLLKQMGTKSSSSSTAKLPEEVEALSDEEESFERARNLMTLRDFVEGDVDDHPDERDGRHRIETANANVTKYLHEQTAKFGPEWERRMHHYLDDER